MERFLNIRYAKLKVTVKFTEDTELVKDKTSAIRGGMGEMLLRMHCIANRECETCGFENECVVQRIMYSEPENRPEFMNRGSSLGYIIECSDKRKNFKSGDKMKFTVTLFGKSIVYFFHFMNAFYMLGKDGLGSNKSCFVIHEVKNLFNETIANDLEYDITFYKWQTIGEYVNYRMEKFAEAGDEPLKIEFKTPTEIKFENEFPETYNEEMLKRSILRRLYILNCYEGMSADERYEAETEFPEITESQLENNETYRYSERSETLMKLCGKTGYVTVKNPTEEWMKLLCAAEIMHIGKNTSFGFGGIKLT